ncbi:MAG: D-tyrosyl-tRNA(Tyr) deacylase [Gammaproteobacteria bacterium TMED78]|nr:MAG: D-tyrosyl-tRNA(Tyr) deacylase [Gammaproteobacteria bacterium TMED78]|tara:strand:+ start:192 stop:629 length:438 start_codon:yes stop_codon:yes gene_type:complete
MVFLIQRVSKAKIAIRGTKIAEISNGLLVLVGVEKDDNSNVIKKLIDKLLKFRVFNDKYEKMNLNIEQVKGQILFAPQFTLLADHFSGNRPSFSKVPSNSYSRDIYNKVIAEIEKNDVYGGSGVFGEDMEISLINQGPATFWLNI